MNKKIQKNMVIGGIFVTLSFLPGCSLFDMFKGKNENIATEDRVADGAIEITGDVLVTLKGKPVITTDVLATEKEKFFKSNPQLAEALRHMNPKEFERNLLEGLIGQCVADEYVFSNDIHQLESYKNELAELQKTMGRMLNAKFFNEKLEVSVSDSEVKSFYDAHKDKMQGIVISHGGIAAQGIEFANAVDARAFLTKAKMTKDFKKAAQEDGLTANIKDFKLVNVHSVGIDEVLRDKIVAMKTIPTTEMIEASDNKYWVVAAMSKEEPKYVPYEQIKDRLKQQLEQNKRVELLEKKISELRKEFGVIVNEEYFASDNQESEGSAAVTGGLAQSDTQETSFKRMV